MYYMRSENDPALALSHELISQGSILIALGGPGGIVRQLVFSQLVSAVWV